jgi:CheY-like chemotaxis protein
MKKKILIAEDDAVIRDVLKEHMENEGYDVLTAANGEEAVSVTRSERPDLIIMDIFMPVMDGWEATKIIKSDKAFADTQVICLSAYASPENAEKSVEAQCDLVLVKPLYPDVLKRHVRELLNI